MPLICKMSHKNVMKCYVNGVRLLWGENRTKSSRNDAKNRRMIPLPRISCGIGRIWKPRDVGVIHY